MKPILVQGAENSEINYLLQLIEEKREIEIGTFKFWIGKIDTYPIVISRTKVGEVNASIATTIGIMNFDPICIINQGTAGGHLVECKRGDIVVGEEYQFLTHFMINSCEYENKENWILREFNSDDDKKISKKANLNLIKLVKQVKDEFKNNVYFGVIGSGDIWNREIERIKYLNKEYKTLCEDMETEGVYKTANSFGVPVLGIRIISNNEILKEDYKPELSTNCQIFVEKLLIKIIENIKNGDEI